MLSTNSSLDLGKSAPGLSERCTLWQSHLRSTASIDRNALAQSINQLYELVNKPAPQIVWCESPWQSAAMAAVLEKQITSSAIKKWNNHLFNLRLSENDCDQLWKNMWRQLDAQLSETERKEILAPDAQTQRTKEERWQSSWMGKLSFKRSPLIKTQWNETSKLIQAEWLRIAKEMRALCTIRLEHAPEYAEMESRYREIMAPWISRAFDRQLQNEFVAFASAGFPVNVFERLTGQALANASLEVLKGHVQEEFDKIYTPEERKAFEFAITLIIISATSRGSESANEILSMIPFYDYLCDELPDLPVGPIESKASQNIFKYPAPDSLHFAL